jgi:elongation factor G
MDRLLFGINCLRQRTDGTQLYPGHSRHLRPPDPSPLVESSGELHYRDVKSRPAVSESSTHKRPIICVVIRPKTDDDRQSLQRALSELVQQDPTIGIETESPDGQTTISGMGELHLEVICDRIVREYKVQIEIGKPKIIYLETIRKQSEAEGKYVRAVSRHCIYGHVKLGLEPLTRQGLRP